MVKLGAFIAFFVAPGAVGNGLARLELEGVKDDLDATVVAPEPLLSPFMPCKTCKAV